MSRNHGIITMGLVIVLGLALVGTYMPVAAAGLPPGWKPPKSIVLRDASIKGVGYVWATAIAIAIEETTGVRASAPPTDSGLGQLIPIKQMREHVTFLPAGETYLALTGQLTFKRKGWGPQSLRLVWFGAPLVQGFATQGNSGIKTIKDVVGRKLTRTPPGSSDLIRYNAFFAYSCAHPDYPCLSWDKVKPVPVPEFGPGQQAVLTGATDVGIMSATSAAAQELAASLRGIHWIPLPNKTDADKKAWEAWRKVNPGEGIAFHTESPLEAAGASKEKPADLYAWAYQVVCYDFYPGNELIYWLVKAMVDSYDRYKNKHALLKYWNLDYVFEHMGEWYVPWHDGAINYFKDVGRWTPKCQAKQDELLQKYPQRNTK